MLFIILVNNYLKKILLCNYFLQKHNYSDKQHIIVAPISVGKQLEFVSVQSWWSAFFSTFAIMLLLFCSWSTQIDWSTVLRVLARCRYRWSRSTSCSGRWSGSSSRRTRSRRVSGSGTSCLTRSSTPRAMRWGAGSGPGLTWHPSPGGRPPLLIAVILQQDSLFNYEVGHSGDSCT